MITPSYYRIHDFHRRPLEISVLGDYVVEAPPELDIAIGYTFAHLRLYCERKGWAIEPIADTPPVHIEYAGAVYFFIRERGRIVQIIKHENGEESIITYSELPEIVKRIL